MIVFKVIEFFRSYGVPSSAKTTTRKPFLAKPDVGWKHKIHLQPYSDKQMYEAYTRMLKSRNQIF